MRRETVLADAANLVAGSLVVAGGKAVVVPSNQTVAQLKTLLGVSVVTTCDAAARRVQTSPVGEEFGEL